MHTSPRPKFADAPGIPCRSLVARLLREISELPVGCYAVGEFHAPHAEQQKAQRRGADRPERHVHDVIKLGGAHRQ